MFEYYLDSEIRVLRFQRGREQSEYTEDQVFTSSFLKNATDIIKTARESDDRTMRLRLEDAVLPKDHQTITGWLRKYFGKNSPRGYTVLHPHKSDACSFCCAASTATSSPLHDEPETLQSQQLHDQGTLERQALKAENPETFIVDLKVGS